MLRNSTFAAWLTIANRDMRLGYACLGAMFGCGLMLFAIPAYSDLTYWWNGQSVQAVVTTAPAETRNPPKFGPKYLVRYEFSDAGGTMHQGEGRVRDATGFRPGDLIEVRYLPTEPARSRLQASLRPWPPLFIACLGAVIFAVSVWRGIRSLGHVTEKALAERPLVETSR